MASEYFKGKKEFITLVDRAMDVQEQPIIWMTNIDTLLGQFNNIPYFDESLRNDGENMYFIMGAKSRIYT